MFLAAAVALLLAADPGGAPSPGLWETNGPAYPASDLIVPAPDDENVVYAGAHDPGTGKSALFRSRDGGTSWETVAEAPSGETLTRFAIDPTGPERMLALTAPPASDLSHVYRSDDAGTTWRLQATFPSAGELFFDSARPNTAVFASTSGLSLSAAGEDWANLFAAPPLINNAWISPGGRVFRQIQSFHMCGASWFPGALHSQIWFSDIGGSNEGCASDLQCPISAVAYAPSRTGLAYATGGLCDPLLASEDGGTVWTSVDSRELKQYLEDLPNAAIEGIAVDPTDEARLFATLRSTGEPAGLLLRSDDGGRHWTARPVPATPTGPLAISPSGRFLYVGTDAGVYRLSLTRTRALSPRD